MYEDGYKTIVGVGENCLGQLRTTVPGQYKVEREDDEVGQKARESARQKVMCCLAYCFSLYRKHSPQNAKIKLDECEQFLCQHLIDSEETSPDHFSVGALSPGFTTFTGRFFGLSQIMEVRANGSPPP